MMIKIHFTLLLLLITTTTVKSQTKKEQKGFDYGVVEDNIYTNSFFNFKLNIPLEWSVQSKEQTEYIVEFGKELASGDDKNMKAIIKASEVNSAYLLTVYQYKLGSAVDYNPSFMLIAENLKFAPGIKKGSDYLFQARKLLKQSKIEYSHIDNDFKKIMIDNHEFYIMNVEFDYLGVNIKQSYYSTVINKFSVNFISSFVNIKQENKFKEIINTLKFY